MAFLNVRSFCKSSFGARTAMDYESEVYRLSFRSSCGDNKLTEQISNENKLDSICTVYHRQCNLLYMLARCVTFFAFFLSRGGSCYHFTVFNVILISPSVMIFTAEVKNASSTRNQEIDRERGKDWGREWNGWATAENLLGSAFVSLVFTLSRAYSISTSLHREKKNSFMFGCTQKKWLTFAEEMHVYAVGAMVEMCSSECELWLPINAGAGNYSVLYRRLNVDMLMHIKITMPFSRS